jgi:hypothetical protein
VLAGLRATSRPRRAAAPSGCARTTAATARLVDVVNRVFDRALGRRAGPLAAVRAPARRAAGRCATSARTRRGRGAAELAAAEADAIADAILGWVRADPPVPCGRPGGERPLGFGDVAVLARGHGVLEVLEARLPARGVPVLNAGGGDVLATQEGRDARALLRAVVDPTDGVAVAALLRSPYVAAHDADVARFAAAAPGEAVPAARSARGPDRRGPALVAAPAGHRGRARRGGPGAAGDAAAGAARARAGGARASELLGLADELSGVRAVLAHLPHGARRVADHDGVVALLERLEQGHADALGVVRRLERLVATGVKVPRPPLRARGAVALLTIHAAKGLEWPAVVVADLAGGGGRDRDDVLLDPDVGFALRWPDGRGGRAVPATYRYAAAAARAATRPSGAGWPTSPSPARASCCSSATAAAPRAACARRSATRSASTGWCTRRCRFDAVAAPVAPLPPAPPPPDPDDPLWRRGRARRGGRRGRGAGPRVAPTGGRCGGRWTAWTTRTPGRRRPRAGRRGRAAARRDRVAVAARARGTRHRARRGPRLAPAGGRVAVVDAGAGGVAAFAGVGFDGVRSVVGLDPSDPAAVVAAVLAAWPDADRARVTTRRTAPRARAAATNGGPGPAATVRLSAGMTDVTRPVATRVRRARFGYTGAGVSAAVRSGAGVSAPRVTWGRMPRLLHLADLHLGWTPARAAARGGRRRAAPPRRLLGEAVDVALRRAGRPGRRRRRPVRVLPARAGPGRRDAAAAAAPRRRRRRPVTVPGNHDELTYARSVYRLEAAAWPGVLVTRPDPGPVARFRFGGVDVHVTALAYVGGVTPGGRAPARVPPGAATGGARGGVPRHPGRPVGAPGDPFAGGRSLPIDAARSPRPASTTSRSGTCTCPRRSRSGPAASPCTPAASAARGRATSGPCHWTIVELGDGPARVRRVPADVAPVWTREVDVGAVDDAAELEARLRGLGRARRVGRVRLTGSLGFDLDAAALRARAADAYLHLEVEDATSSVADALLDAGRPSRPCAAPSCGSCGRGSRRRRTSRALLTRRCGAACTRWRRSRERARLGRRSRGVDARRDAPAGRAAR